MNLSERLEYAEDLFCDGKYEESSREFDRLLNIAAGEERLAVAERWVDCLIERYSELSDQKKNNEALVLCEKALKLLMFRADRFNERILLVRNDRAAILSEIERYDEAASEYNELISECSALYGSKGHDTLIAMGNFAGVLHDIGKIPQAIQLRSRAINGLRLLHGETDTDYMRELVNLSHDYEDIGNFFKAISVLKTVYELRKRALGKNNDMTINALFQLAVCYKRIQQSYEAVRLFEIAVNSIESDDFYTLIHKVQYAICCAWIGEKSQAELLIDMVLGQIGSADFGVNIIHENLEYAYSSIALYELDYGAAVRHAEKAIHCIEGQNGAEETYSAKKYLAEVLFYAGEYNRAYSLLEHISEYYENSESCIFEKLMYQFIRADILSALGHFEYAEASVSELMRISRQCTFAAAPFLAYSAGSYLALQRGDHGDFERLKAIALAYAMSGMDMREFEVLWLKSLK